MEDGIIDIQEPQTCRYLIQVHVHSLCKLSVFRRSKVGHVQTPITCKPALNQKDYDAFTEREKEDQRKREVEELERLQNAPLSSIEKSLLKQELNDLVNEFLMEQDYISDVPFLEVRERYLLASKIRQYFEAQLDGIADQVEISLYYVPNGEKRIKELARKSSYAYLSKLLEQITTRIELGHHPIVPSESDTVSDDKGSNIEITYDDETQPELSEEIKRELEKIGINTVGRHVEIRVITAPNAAKANLLQSQSYGGTISLSSEGSTSSNSKQLGQMLAAVLQSDSKIFRRAFEQQMLESHYATNFNEDFSRDHDGANSETDGPDADE